MSETPGEDFAERLICASGPLDYFFRYPGRAKVQVIFADYRLDTNQRELCRGSEPVAVEPQVFDLLVHLICNRDRVVTKDDLITSVWNGRIVFDSTLASRVNAARQAIGDDDKQQRLIRTAAEIRERALLAAQRAITLDADDAMAHCTFGRVRYLRREYSAAISELQTALQLNPSLALAHYGLGAALVFSGRPAEAFPHLERAIRLSPHDPNMGSFLVRIADAKYFVHDYEGAVSCALRALGQRNFQWSRYAVLIAALGQLGRFGEARNFYNELARARPDFSIGFVRETHLFGTKDIMNHYCEGLCKADIPDLR